MSMKGLWMFVGLNILFLIGCQAQTEASISLTNDELQVF